MTKSRFLFFLASTLVVVPLMAGSLIGVSAQNEQAEETDSLYKYLAVFTETLGMVDQAYVEETEFDELMAGAFDGITDALDPLSVYVPERAVSSYEETRDLGSARSGLRVLRERGNDYILTVDAGSPGAEVGLQAGDVITEIQGRVTRTMPLWEVQQILAAEPGTRIEMRLLRLGEPEEVSFQLAEFSPPTVELERRDDVHVLRIPSFGPDTAERVAEALTRVPANAPALAVDLRGTAGGSAEAAYQTATLFARGELGRLVQRGEVRRSFGDPVAVSGSETTGSETTGFEATATPAPWQGPLVVVIDRSTLGPAEILAQVLREKAGAELVGQRTFGHAGEIEPFDLSSGARLYLTAAFYTGPDFEPLDEPLRPDVSVSPRFGGGDEVEVEGESEGAAVEADPVLDRALEHLRALRDGTVDEESEEAVAA